MDNSRDESLTFVESVSQPLFQGRLRVHRRQSNRGTPFNLVICIFATAGHHFLEVRITHVIHDYEWLSSELLEVILEERGISSGNNKATNIDTNSEHE